MSQGVVVAGPLPRPEPRRTSRRVLVAASALTFVASSALTIVWVTSMSTTGGMPMAAGRTTSMVWAGMNGHAWPRALASFVAMWVVMTLAMMLPSLTPALWSYHWIIDRTGAATRPGRLTAVMAVGYFAVWASIGVALLPLRAALAAAEMRLPALARAAPHMVGVVVLVVGAVQFTAWKARHLAHCRVVPSRDSTMSVNAAAAWRHGLRLGVHCSLSCAGLMTILLAIGIMDLQAMGLVTAAITAERLAPDGVRAARAIGALALGVGLLLAARAAGAV